LTYRSAICAAWTTSRTRPSASPVSTSTDATIFRTSSCAIVASGLDQKRALIKWANQPFSYDPNTVWDGDGVPLHQAAAQYYRERGYMRDVVGGGQIRASTPLIQTRIQEGGRT